MSHLVHRVEDTLKSVQILRETLERRFRPDEVVESKVEDIEINLKLLLRELKQQET